LRLIKLAERTCRIAEVESIAGKRMRGCCGKDLIYARWRTGLGIGYKSNGNWRPSFLRYSARNRYKEKLQMLDGKAA